MDNETPSEANDTINFVSEDTVHCNAEEVVINLEADERSYCGAKFNDIAKARAFDYLIKITFVS